MNENLVLFDYKPLNTDGDPTTDGQVPRVLAKGLLTPTNVGAETIKQIASSGGTIFLSEGKTLPICDGCTHQEDAVGCGRLKTTFVRLWQRSGVARGIIVSAHQQYAEGQGVNGSSKPDDSAPCKKPHSDIPMHTS